MKTALVTGASRGLGAAMAKALAAAGWAVAVNYAHDDAGAARVVDDIAMLGGKAASFKFDVTDKASVRHGIATIAHELAPVELIVNNATGPQPMMPIEDQSWDDHLDQLRFFVKAPLLLLQTVLPDWKTRKVGRVINIGSEVVDIGNPDFGHYVAAKAAMVGLTRSWARELGPYGINVNLVAPGFVPVERHATATADDIEDYRRDVPLARMGVPEEIAATVGFLASPQADFITGQTIAVNGGRTLA
ncbi:SDR family oxidoreductase [Kaistia dalseonensis]|uniref:3-oxoacyl-[acyl-carrier protein] reductase n=1 Tax=Kaistia dalseonensis TaxID=410840 RepID=A0ABU0H8G7_9HYPH|nr:SDR family oxidoreductase [Kaistia dalseonensis]MCX5496000.1 SDR family oxidoreductase [Kaistia dalseonensis]MDQ0438603.1 3-oxoacyl-[acyl-carrier protein] reductase [Kaistia dalseonensis]